MCGICGLWLRSERVSPSTLIGMRDVMAHRGPDGASGVLLSAAGEPAVPFREHAPADASSHRHNVGLGHRRLAIIDLVSGDQPMAGSDPGVWLVYNGELYNYRELRDKLAAAGHTFRTQSDTEVVLRAYEEYGERCPAHLNGIFAFAVWDGPRRRLFVARDHFGVKPLYYAQTSDGFVFGSEVKAVLASGLLRAELDADSLGLALTFRYTPSPATLFRGVRRLAPGSSLTVTADGARPAIWFAESGAGSDPDGSGEWAERLASAIEGAVHRQMISDVPIGLSLSSGVDSSTLLAAMSQRSPEPVRAFTIGFAGATRDDEVLPAREVAERYAARFESRRLGDQEYLSFMSRYMWHMEEPVGNESAPAYFFVAEMAREAGVKVLLTGQGPDELFAGYDRHVGIAFSRLLRMAAVPWMQAAIRRGTRGRAMGEKYTRFLASAGASTLEEQLLGTYTVFAREEAQDLLAPDVYRVINWELPRAYVDGWLGRAPAGTPLERMLWIDTRTLLSDNLLLAEDKMAMAASVEARVPFLDVELVRLAESIPGSMKLRLGRRKHVYRQACARLIGSQASRRRKIGFANPMAAWFRSAYQDTLLEGLDDPGSFLTTYVRPDAVREMLREHRSGQRDHTRKLYFLASLQAWHATFCV